MMWLGVCKCCFQYPLLVKLWCEFCVFVGNPQLHMQAVIVVLLSTFAGFGITMAGTSILTDALRRRRWQAQSRHQPVTGESTQPDQLSSTTRQTPTESLHLESEVRDSESTWGSWHDRWQLFGVSMRDDAFFGCIETASLMLVVCFCVQCLLH